MSVYPVYWILNYTILVFNIIITIFCFGVKKRRRVPILMIGAAVLLFNIAVYLHPVTASIFEQLPVSLIWIVFLLMLNDGNFFAKLFIYFGAFYITLYLYVSSSFAAEVFFIYESDGYFVFLAAMAFTLLSSYCIFVKLYARKICDKLFIYASTAEWLVYMTIPIFSLSVIGYAYMTQGGIWHPAAVRMDLYFLILPTVMLAFYAFIIIAILNTYEKSKYKYEAAFAHNIISSGRDHYQKMDEMYDKFRILRHDYKFHLNAARKMLASGDMEVTDKYLNSVEYQLSQYEVKTFCTNAVINALVAGYDDRCTKLAIKFDVNLNIPESLGIPNYDLCIVLGNLLENAVEACEKLDRERIIKLETQNIHSQLLFMIQNSFDGVTQHDNGTPLSTKMNGGFGLRSVKEVIARHNGDFTVEWDKDTFTAFVAVRL